jgi:hypothetical protein
VLFAASFLALGVRACRRVTLDDAAGRIESALAAALVVPGALVVLAFVLNRNIFNSDNYRYLVLLIVPYAVGFGLVCDGLVSREWRRGAVVLVMILAVLMTGQTGMWYSDLGWLGAGPAPRDPLVSWLVRHPEIRDITGSYWDVYPLAFRLRVAGVPVRAVPLRGEPDRFDDRGPVPRTLIVTGRGVTPSLRRQIVEGRARPLDRIGDVLILDWQPEEGARP